MLEADIWVYGVNTKEDVTYYTFETIIASCGCGYSKID